MFDVDQDKVILVQPQQIITDMYDMLVEREEPVQDSCCKL